MQTIQKESKPFCKGHRAQSETWSRGRGLLRGGGNALKGFSEGRKGCGNLMEIPGSTELAFLKFKGKWLLPLVGSRNQRGPEASRKVRAPNSTSQNLRRGRAADSNHMRPAPRGGLAPSSI